MGAIAELGFDNERCRHCGHKLYENVASKNKKQILYEHEGELTIATIVDIRCGYCGALNRIFYIGDPLPLPTTARANKREFACVPTMEA